MPPLYRFSVITRAYAALRVESAFVFCQCGVKSGCRVYAKLAAQRDERKQAVAELLLRVRRHSESGFAVIGSFQQLFAQLSDLGRQVDIPLVYSAAELILIEKALNGAVIYHIGTSHMLFLYFNYYLSPSQELKRLFI